MALTNAQKQAAFRARKKAVVDGKFILTINNFQCSLLLGMLQANLELIQEGVEGFESVTSDEIAETSALVRQLEMLLKSPHIVHSAVCGIAGRLP